MAGAPRATDRLRRLLSMVPFIAAHPEGVSITEICTRFGISETQLLRDLEVVMMVGVYPYTPDSLIEVFVDDDTATIRLADYFARPLQLTPAEGLALSAGLAALAAVPGAEIDGVVTRTVEKLTGLLGERSTTGSHPIDVDLGVVAGDVFDAVDGARRDQTRVEIDYYSVDSDERTTRTIEPAQLWNVGGYWYVSGFCHRAGETRVFRLDRIAEAHGTTETFSRTPDLLEEDLAFTDPDLPRVRLRVAARSAWLFDGLSVETLPPGPDGSVEVVLAVVSRRWLEPLLVQAGRDVEILEIDERLGTATIIADTAARVLARYDTA